MAPPSKKKRRRQEVSMSPELERLLHQLEEWFSSTSSDSRMRAKELQSANEAASAVVQALPSISYDESLNGWWKWYQQASHAASTSTPDLKTQLHRNVLEEAHQAVAATPELQLARLLPPVVPIRQEGDKTNLWHVLKQLLPDGRTKPAKARLSQDLANTLWPYLEHDNGLEAPFDFHWMDSKTGRCYCEQTDTGERGLAQLIRRLWDCAATGVRAITYTVRIRSGSELHHLCQKQLDKHYHMTDTICPDDQWCFGPPTSPANVTSEANETIRANRLPSVPDPRYYLLLGTPGALTKSHWDRGVQTVLYHTIAGTNHALAVPRRVAQMLHAVDDGLNSTLAEVGHGDGGKKMATWSNSMEYEALVACKDHIRAGTFEEGETMLIMPGGGHAILTGDQGKVVVAGEWHMRTDV